MVHLRFLGLMTKLVLNVAGVDTKAVSASGHIEFSFLYLEEELVVLIIAGGIRAMDD